MIRDSDKSTKIVPSEEMLGALQSPPACPACGAAARRPGARFCATCGRRLDGDGYLPADSIRASYHQQRRRPATPAVAATPGRPFNRSARVQSSMPFIKNSNGASTTALAFVTYALVPYLGILFCPGAVLMGGIGLLRAHRLPHLGGRSASVLSIVMGLLILCVQLVLWWILYKVPEWAQRP